MPVATIFDQAQADQNNALKSDALKSVLMALAGGAALGSGMKLWNSRKYLFGAPATDLEEEEKRRRLNEQFVPLPYPAGTPAPPRSGRAKLAGILDTKVVAGEPLPPSNFGTFLLGNSAGGSNKINIPWFLPSWTLAGLGGMAAGHGLTSAWVRSKRKAQLDEEVEDAKKEYRKALLSQYASPKQAAERSVGDDLGAELDAIGALLEKRGFLGGPAGAATGVGLTLASLLALGSGYLSYQNAKSKSPAKLVEEAFRRRQIAQAEASPPQITVVPVPVKRRQPEEDGDPIMGGAGSPNNFG